MTEKLSLSKFVSVLGTPVLKAADCDDLVVWEVYHGNDAAPFVCEACRSERLRTLGATFAMHRGPLPLLRPCERHQPRPLLEAKP